MATTRSRASAHLHHKQSRQRGLRPSWGAVFAVGNTTTTKRVRERERELEEGKEKREGAKEENTMAVQAMTVLLFNKTGWESSRYTDGPPRIYCSIFGGLLGMTGSREIDTYFLEPIASGNKIMKTERALRLPLSLE